jgi:hypothetical protein
MDNAGSAFREDDEWLPESEYRMHQSRSPPRRVVSTPRVGGVKGGGTCRACSKGVHVDHTCDRGRKRKALVGSSSTNLHRGSEPPRAHWAPASDHSYPWASHSLQSKQAAMLPPPPVALEPEAPKRVDLRALYSIRGLAPPGGGPAAGSTGLSRELPTGRTVATEVDSRRPTVVDAAWLTVVPYLEQADRLRLARVCRQLHRIAMCSVGWNAVDLSWGSVTDPQVRVCTLPYVHPCSHTPTHRRTWANTDGDSWCVSQVAAAARVGAPKVNASWTALTSHQLRQLLGSTASVRQLNICGCARLEQPCLFVGLYAPAMTRLNLNFTSVTDSSLT